MVVLGGAVVSYERGAPVGAKEDPAWGDADLSWRVPAGMVLDYENITIYTD